MFFSLFNPLFAIFFLALGNNTLAVSLPVIMAYENVPVDVIGNVLAMFSVGMILGALYGKKFVARVGHIRAYAGLAAFFAIIIAFFPFQFNSWFWAILRVFNGFCVIALAFVIESWINASVDSKNRNKVMGLYQMINAAAVMLAPFVMLLASQKDIGLSFQIASLMVLLSLMPMTLSRKKAPDSESDKKIKFKEVYRLSPTGVLGALGSGICFGAFISLMPVYGTQQNLSSLNLSLFLSSTVLGAVIMQLPVAKIADVFDKRKVMAFLLLLLTAASGAIWFLNYYSYPLYSPWLLFVLVGIMGGCIYCLYPLSVAQVFNWIDTRFAVPVTSFLLLLFSLGCFVGPLIAGQIMKFFGIDSFLLFFAGFAPLFMVYLLYRAIAHPPLPKGLQQKVVQSYDVLTNASLPPSTYQEENKTTNWQSLEAKVAGKMIKSNPDKAVDIALSMMQVVFEDKQVNEFDYKILAQITTAAAAANPNEQQLLLEKTFALIDENKQAKKFWKLAILETVLQISACNWQQTLPFLQQFKDNKWEECLHDLIVNDKNNNSNFATLMVDEMLKHQAGSLYKVQNSVKELVKNHSQQESEAKLCCWINLAKNDQDKALLQILYRDFIQT